MATVSEKLTEATEYLDKTIVALREAYVDARPVLFGAITAVADMLESQLEVLEGVASVALEEDDEWLTDVQASMRLRRDDPAAYEAKQQAEYDAQQDAMQALFSGLFSDEGGDSAVAYGAPDDAVNVTHLDGVGTLKFEPYVVQGPDSVSD